MHKKVNTNFLKDMAFLFTLSLFFYGFYQYIFIVFLDFQESLHIEKNLFYFSSFSLIRSLIALIMSYLFAFIYGKYAASLPKAEKILISILDVLQSLPVLAFLPGFVLILISLFPNNRFGIELSCILMIFTGQVWNLIFAYYESQKQIPRDFLELAQIEKFTKWQRFFWLDLPFASKPLIYNGMMSMAGGWFFLTLCEAFTLNKKNFYLPGLGSFMRDSIDKSNYSDFCQGLCCLVFIILSVDFLVWKPLLNNKKSFLTHSRIPIYLKKVFFQINWKPVVKTWNSSKQIVVSPLYKINHTKMGVIHFLKKSYFIFLGGFIFYMLPLLPKLGALLEKIDTALWITLIQNLFLTFLRVLSILFLAVLWTVPVGIWIGKNERLTKYLQPCIQNLASFPAPVLFPLITLCFIQWGIFNGFIPIVLMLIGNQWYILFNVIGGTLKIPEEYFMLSKSLDFKFWHRVKYIYLPAIFPSLTTGLITAAGGAWNASIVAEWVSYPGGVFKADGIGSVIAQATEQGQGAILSASIFLICLFLALLDKTVWFPMQKFSEKMRIV